MNFGLFLTLDAIRKAGGDPFIVGGTAREQFMPEPRNKTDLDIEVFNIPAATLEEILRFACNKVDYVGKHFGVYKVEFSDGNKADISLPRTEVKRGAGHLGFDVTPSPRLTPAQAAARRDFTMNAIMIPAIGNMQQGVADPFNGRKDIQDRVLRAVGPQFSEDPLRVLRAVQFAARFDMTMDDATVTQCIKLLPEYSTLPKERIWAEWEKWARLGRKPSAGLRILSLTEWIMEYPELLDMQITMQDTVYHPEGNVWNHTLHAVDQAVLAADRDNASDEDRVVGVFAALLHDVGKADTTVVQTDGRITSHGHDKAGIIVAGRFLDRIGAPAWVKQRVVNLVGEHMWGVDGQYSQRAVRRLTHRLGQAGNTIRDLTRLVTADNSARPPLGGGVPMRMLQAEMDAAQMGVVDGGPKPILLGRHLIDMGWTPGPKMGTMLKKAFEAQLDGEFYDLGGATTWVGRQVYPV